MYLIDEYEFKKYIDRVTRATATLGSYSALQG